MAKNRYNQPDQNPAYITLGNIIRQLWVEHRRLYELTTKGVMTGWGSKYMAEWDGGETKTGTFKKPVWPNIAKFCDDNNLHPEILIRCMFDGVIGYAPNPNQALSDIALGKYNLYNSKQRKLERLSKLRADFESQKVSITSEVFSRQNYLDQPEEIAWRAAICDIQPGYSALFRYCVAINQNWEDIANEYKQQAIWEYKLQPELYDEIWKEWLPKNIKNFNKVSWKDVFNELGKSTKT